MSLQRALHIQTATGPRWEILSIRIHLFIHLELAKCYIQQYVYNKIDTVQDEEKKHGPSHLWL